jgi:hypothetical protein
MSINISKKGGAVEKKSGGMIGPYPQNWYPKDRAGGWKIFSWKSIPTKGVYGRNIFPNFSFHMEKR